MRRIALLLTLLPAFLSAQTPFSRDSAYAALTVIATNIGPRPMGSPAERRAMGFALQKFHEYGLSEVYLLPMSETDGDSPGRTVNTSSGAAVGVLKGETDSIIVIGGHIDSASPEIPGANDDGSGSATVIELARVLSQRKNHSTIVFCVFGGEEQGVRGSRFFAKTFPAMDRVKLMFQVDMANAGWLLPLIESGDRRSPQWLVSAAYEEFRALGYSGLSYPTHFLTLNNAMPGGGIGSDHEPFVERGIPAIDFTSDLTDPIHTAQDNLTEFNPDGLKRTGDLVYRLVERFDRSMPADRNERYYLIDFFSHAVFVPIWVLGIVSVLTFVVAGFALVSVRRRRTETERASRPKVPALKLFLLMLIVQSFVWLSENVVSVLKGERYPWLDNMTGYVVLGGLAGILGIWIALQISPRLKLSRDPYRWYLRAFVWLAVLTIVFAFSSVRMMVYPAFGLLFLSLAILVRVPILQFLLWLISPHLMFRLLINEGSPLFSRSMVLLAPALPTTQSVILHIGMILFFSLWAFPFLLGFAAILSDSRKDLLGLSLFRRRTGLWVAGGAAAVCIVVLLFLPSRSDRWNQVIRVDQTLTLPGGTLKAAVHSTEYLGGTRLRFDGRDTMLTGRSCDAVLFSRSHADSSWVSVDRLVTARTDASGGYDLQLKLRMREQPYSLTVTYSGPAKVMQNAVTTFAANTSERRLSIRWYSFPDSVLTVPVRFASMRPDSVTETIEAVFVHPIVPMTAEKPKASVVTRSTVVRMELLRAPF